jgi:L-lactate dehydrogenase complex protein LldG
VSAREQILGHVRAALRDVPAGEEPAPAGPPPPPRTADADLFAARVAAYRATVTRCAPDEVAGTVATIGARHGVACLATAPGLPGDWLPADLEAVRDDPPLATAQLDAVDGVLTGAAAGIAETGTIVLDGAPRSGRRALTLVPDLHICVVQAADLVADVPQATAVWERAARDGRPVTLVSGPSATSDIEFDRVEGVHGPRRLEVVLVQA